MKKLLLIIFWVLVTSGCNSTPAETKGDMNRIGKELIIVVHSYKTGQELNLAVPNPSEGLRGQAVYSKQDNKCDIHISEEAAPKFSNSYYKILGHEMTHCLYGDYHK